MSAAHVVILRPTASGDALEVLLQRRSRAVYQGDLYGFPGGSLDKLEAALSGDSSIPEETRWAVWWRAALRELVEECGAGKGPGLLPVVLPEVCSLKAKTIVGVALPSSLVRLDVATATAFSVEVSSMGITSYFFFHVLEPESAQWLARAQPRHRWEVDESAPGTVFGYRWLAVARMRNECFDQLAMDGLQFCSWVKDLLVLHRSEFDRMIELCAELAFSPARRQSEAEWKIKEPCEEPCKEEVECNVEEMGSVHEAKQKQEQEIPRKDESGGTSALVGHDGTSDCPPIITGNSDAQNLMEDASTLPLPLDRQSLLEEVNSIVERLRQDCDGVKLRDPSDQQSMSLSTQDVIKTRVRWTIGPRASVSVLSAAGLRLPQQVKVWAVQKLQGEGSSWEITDPQSQVGHITEESHDQDQVELCNFAELDGACCVQYEDVTTQAAVERFPTDEVFDETQKPATMLCFHGTSRVRIWQIAENGFDPNERFDEDQQKRSANGVGGDYFTTSCTVALGYAQWREFKENGVSSSDVLSVLLVEIPISHASDLRGPTGTGCRKTFAPSQNCSVDGQRSKVWVCYDNRVEVPRAILTFRLRGSKSLENSGLCSTQGLSESIAAWDILASHVTAQCHLKAVLLDLDFTCWPFCLNGQTRGPPFHWRSNGRVVDSTGKEMRLHKDIPEILCALHKSQIPIVICSRSCVPCWCWKFVDTYILDAERSPPLRFRDVVHPASIIHPGHSKEKHLKLIKSALCVPFDSMLFFDDDRRTCNEARRLGVVALHVPQSCGVTKAIFAQGVSLCCSKDCVQQPSQKTPAMTSASGWYEAIPAAETLWKGKYLTRSSSDFCDSGSDQSTPEPATGTRSRHSVGRKSSLSPLMMRPESNLATTECMFSCCIGHKRSESPMRAQSREATNIPLNAQSKARHSLSPQRKMTSQPNLQPRASMTHDKPRHSLSPQRGMTSQFNLQPRASLTSVQLGEASNTLLNSQSKPRQSLSPQRRTTSQPNLQPRASLTPEKPRHSLSPQKGMTSQANLQPRASLTPDKPRHSLSPQRGMTSQANLQPRASLTPEKPRHSLSPQRGMTSQDNLQPRASLTPSPQRRMTSQANLQPRASLTPVPERSRVHSANMSWVDPLNSTIQNCNEHSGAKVPAKATSPQHHIGSPNKVAGVDTACEPHTRQLNSPNQESKKDSCASPTGLSVNPETRRHSVQIPKRHSVQNLQRRNQDCNKDSYAPPTGLLVNAETTRGSVQSPKRRNPECSKESGAPPTGLPVNAEKKRNSVQSPNTCFAACETDSVKESEKDGRPRFMQSTSRSRSSIVSNVRASEIAALRLKHTANGPRGSSVGEKILHFEAVSRHHAQKQSQQGTQVQRDHMRNVSLEGEELKTKHHEQVDAEHVSDATSVRIESSMQSVPLDAPHKSQGPLHCHDVDLSVVSPAVALEERKKIESPSGMKCKQWKEQHMRDLSAMKVAVLSSLSEAGKDSPGPPAHSDCLLCKDSLPEGLGSQCKEEEEVDRLEIENGDNGKANCYIGNHSQQGGSKDQASECKATDSADSANDADEESMGGDGNGTDSGSATQNEASNAAVKRSAGPQFEKESQSSSLRKKLAQDCLALASQILEVPKESKSPKKVLRTGKVNKRLE